MSVLKPAGTTLKLQLWKQNPLLAWLYETDRNSALSVWGAVAVEVLLLQADVGRDVGCRGLATGKSSCHFIPKVSGALGRKQELLKKCIQGNGVPFLRKGTAFWPSPGLGGIAWQAGGEGIGLASRDLLTTGAVESFRFLAPGELCWLIGTKATKVYFFCVLFALFGCPIKYPFCFYP